MRIRAAITALVAASLLLPAAPAMGHDTDGPVQEDETEPVERASDNVELVAHHYFPEGSDMMFQRREGRQLLGGEEIDDTRDYAFVGGDAKDATAFGAMHVFDVTDDVPEHLAAIPCAGYHAEVGVYENLMFQGIDAPGTNRGCADPDVWDPHNLDRPGRAGIRVFDVTDPANPVVAGFIGPPEGVTAVHNFTVNPRDGLLYLAYSGGGRLGVVDLEARDQFGERTFPTTNLDLAEDIGVPAEQVIGDCHDIGLNLERDLLACAASISGQTYIWSISEDPEVPSHVSTIVLDEIVHHGARWAPDGTTLVLNDEFAGALDSNVDDDNDVGVGSNGCLGPNGKIGAIYFYDTTDPATPLPYGSFTPTFPEPTASPCTSHFYNFIPGTTQVVVGWYEAGMVVADYALTNPLRESAVLLPELGNFWSAYYWDGLLYGASRTIADKGFGGGLWVARMDGVDESNGTANPHDEGTSWARWTSPLPLTASADEAALTARFAPMRLAQVEAKLA